jgi:hypothetical protein
MSRTATGCLVILLAASAASADILPVPDRGPPMADVAGLTFQVQDVSVRFPPGYSKTLQVAVLTGCADGTPNCRLAKSRGLIGMEVNSANDVSLEPEQGMVRQIVDAFRRSKSVTLELYRRGAGGEPVKVRFAGGS